MDASWHFAPMSDPENLSLASDFPAATREDWSRVVQAVLKGAPFERLVSTTYDGIAIEPLAPRRGDAEPVIIRPGATAWQALARIDHTDPALANESALDELNGGASGLSLVFEGATGDYGYALPPNEAALARVLEGVELSAGISVELDLSPQAAACDRCGAGKRSRRTTGIGQSSHRPRSARRRRAGERGAARLERRSPPLRAARHRAERTWASAASSPLPMAASSITPADPKWRN